MILAGGLLFAPSLFGAESIYAWGYGDILQSTLTAVKFTFAHNDYQGLFKFALLIAMTMATIATARFGLKGDLYSLPKIFLMSLGVSALFISSTVNTVVYDVNTKQSYVIDNVPWAVGKPLVWFTGMEKHLGELMETTFAVPSDISYSNGGFLTPFALMNGLGQAKIIDPYIFQSVDNFLIDCVMPDIATGYINPQVLSQSEDLWLEFSNTNPARITMYYDQANTHGTVMSCTEAYGTLGATLSAYTNGVGMQSLGKMLGGYSAAQLSATLGTTSNFLMGYSQSSSSLLMQSILLNQFSDTYSNWAAMNGMDTASVAYGTGKGQQTAEANMVISGALGSKYIPVIKGVLTVIIVALTPIVALLLLTPLFGKVLSGYLMTMIWLSLWHIGEVILNFITLTKANSYITGVSSSNGIYTMVTKPVVDASTMDYVNMASSMYWMIPTIAALIVGGFSYMAFQSMTGGMTARVARGEMAATEVGSGSASIGNISHGNYSANKTDSTASMLGGKTYSTNNTWTENSGGSFTNQNIQGGGFTDMNGHKMQVFGNAYMGNDGALHFPQGGMMKDMATGNNIQIGRQSSVLADGSGSGDFSVKSEDGTKTITYGNGKEISRVEIGNGGLQYTASNTNDHSSEEYKGGGGTINLQDGHINNANLAVKTKSAIDKNIQAGIQESSQTAIEKSVTDALAGKKVDSTEAARISQAIMAKTKEGSQTSTQERSLISQSASQALKSVGIDKMDTSSRDFTEIDQGTFTNMTSAAVKAGGGVGLGKFSIGGEASQAWTDGKSVIVSDGKGRHFAHSLSEKEQTQYAQSLTSAYAEKTAASMTSKESFSTSESGSDKKATSHAREAGESRQVAQKIAESLVATYSETLGRNLGIDDSGSLNNRIIESFVEANYKDNKLYGGGKEGLYKALVAGEQGVVEKLSDYSRNYIKVKDPSHVFSDADREIHENIRKDVDKKTDPVVTAGQLAWGSSTTLHTNVNTNVGDSVHNTLAPSKEKDMIKSGETIVNGVNDGVLSNGAQGQVAMLEKSQEKTPLGVDHKAGPDSIMTEVRPDPNAGLKHHMNPTAGEKSLDAAWNRVSEAGLITHQNGTFTGARLADNPDFGRISTEDLSAIVKSEKLDARSAGLINMEIAHRTAKGSHVIEPSGKFDTSGGTSEVATVFNVNMNSGGKSQPIATLEKEK